MRIDTLQDLPLTTVLALDVVAMHPPLAMQIRMMALLLGVLVGGWSSVFACRGLTRSRLVRDFTYTSALPVPEALNASDGMARFHILVPAVLEAAGHRAGQPGMLSCRFRELGDLIRIAGDIAVREEATLVEACHVQMDLKRSRPIEEQIALSRQGVPLSPLLLGEG